MTTTTTTMTTMMMMMMMMMTNPCEMTLRARLKHSVTVQQQNPERANEAMHCRLSEHRSPTMAEITPFCRSGVPSYENRYDTTAVTGVIDQQCVSRAADRNPARRSIATNALM